MVAKQNSLDAGTPRHNGMIRGFWEWGRWLCWKTQARMPPAAKFIWPLVVQPTFTGIPQSGCAGELAYELLHRAVHGYASHDGSFARIVQTALFEVEQHLEFFYFHNAYIQFYTLRHFFGLITPFFGTKYIAMSHCCWKCGEYLVNEKFSGKGHARHICKQCMIEERAHRREMFIQKRELG